MGRKDKIANDIKELLPDNSNLIGSDGMDAREALIKETATSIHERKSAKELAKARLAIKANQEAEAARKAVKAFKEEKKQAQEAVIKQLEEENPYPTAEEAIEMGNDEAAK